MKKTVCGVGLLFLLGCTRGDFSSLPFFSSLPQGITLLESAPAQPGETMIPYSKYVLSNGLTVILSPDHSDPLVHIDVTYHVGSAREQVGKSGFAHFFEHMMFQGSEHVADQQHFKMITEAGGTLNGSTNRDRTNYFASVPSNQLEKVLWLESDRMGFLLGAVSQKKFEIQRDTVKNERAQNYENRPYGLMWETMSQALYPPEHPYSWQPIGYVEDLDRVDVSDLKAFFLRWYGPNNAVLTIGGDINVAQTLKWVNKYFASIPAGPEVALASKQTVDLAQTRYITLQDTIQQPMVVIGWPTEYLGAKSQTNLDTLAKVLGSGANSVLYQRLVKTQQAVDAGAFQDCGELSCTFYVYAMASSGDGEQLKSLYHQLKSALNAFEQQGVTEARLEQISSSAEASAVYKLQSVHGKVAQLAYNQTFYNQPDRIATRLKAISSVTPASVMRAYQRYLQGQHNVVLSVVPRGKANIAVQASNYTLPARNIPTEPTEFTETAGNKAALAVRRPVDNFDRSSVPLASGSVEVQMPSLYRHSFDNGAELLGTQSMEMPIVALEIKLPAGERQAPEGKIGIAALTASVLQDGTTEHTSEQLQAQLDSLGSDIHIVASNYTTSIIATSLTKNLDPTLAIVKEMLFQPAFKSSDFERSKQQLLDSLHYQYQSPAWLAKQATKQVLFSETVFAQPRDGTASSITSISLSDIKAFYERYYTPHGAQVVVVGDVTKDSILDKLAFIAQWQGKVPKLAQPQVTPLLTKQTLYLVDKPNAPQAIVRFVRQGLPFDATGEVFLTQLANFNLAGNFNSRMNQNLREDKGFTYGASGYISANREIGALIFSAQVRQEATAETIQEIQAEMQRFSQEGVSDEEVRFMRLAVGQQDALSYETPAQKTNLLGSILTFSLDDDYLQQRSEIVASVSKQTLNAIARKWFSPSEYQIIVVGDAKTLRPQLEKLSIPLEELEIIH